MAPKDEAPGRSGRLYVVATPIGNLGDVTSRALDVMRSVDVIAAEDTRRTRTLLKRYGVTTRVRSYHDHGEERVSKELVERLEAGEDVALVSDAGTPLVADPGYRIVTACVERGLEVVAVPGPSALVAALSVSGLPPHPFYFGGYLPRRSGQRRARLETLAGLECTLVFYEAPHRAAAALGDMSAVLGPRRAVVARELTKLHEEVLRGTLPELAELASARPLRGELVVLVEGAGGRARRRGRVTGNG